MCLLSNKPRTWLACRVAEEEFFSSIRVGETLGSSLLATGTQLEPQQQLTQQRAGRVQPGRAGAAPGSRRFGTGGGVNSGLLTSTQIFTDSTLMGTACLLPTVDFSLAALLQGGWAFHHPRLVLVLFLRVVMVLEPLLLEVGSR